MGWRFSAMNRTVAVALFFSFPTSNLAADSRPELGAGYEIRLDRGHPWRPPFGLQRVGRPIEVVVQAADRPAGTAHILTVLSRGKEVGRHDVRFPANPPYSARVPIGNIADELILSSFSRDETRPVELAHLRVEIPEIEADAIARPDAVVNPVDLGAILVPSGWLLLGPGQSATLDVAAIDWSRDRPGAALKASFESEPGRVATAPISLRAGMRIQQRLKLGEIPVSPDRDVLSVVLEDGTGQRLWQKAIPVMLVRDPPRRPRFGATYQRLRYDAGSRSASPDRDVLEHPYEAAWAPALRTSSSGCPRGAVRLLARSELYPILGRPAQHGPCYEWAEIISQPAGAVDCVEPLMDKELRYSRVEIVESTAARVHVAGVTSRPTSTTRFGATPRSRIITFIPMASGCASSTFESDPKNDYELSEFIILTPQGAYPFGSYPDPVEAL